MLKAPTIEYYLRCVVAKSVISSDTTVFNHTKLYCKRYMMRIRIYMYIRIVTAPTPPTPLGGCHGSGQKGHRVENLRTTSPLIVLDTINVSIFTL